MVIKSSKRHIEKRLSPYATPTTGDGYVGGRPEHTYPEKVEGYERNVFIGVHHFTVVIPFEGKWDNIIDWYDAMAKASNKRAMVYAVTSGGRSMMLARKRWPEYTQIWEDIKAQIDARFNHGT